MDWTKAKNILIIALILTNIVLILSSSIRGDGEDHSSQAALIAHLKTKNIFVETEIPKKKSRMPVLNVKYDKIAEKEIKKAIKTQKLTLPDKATEESVFSMTDSFLEKCGAMGKSVKHDKIIHTEDSLIATYKNVYEGIPVEDSYIRCIIKNGSIVEFERYWLEPIKTSIRTPRKKQEVISASSALMKFANENKEEEKIYIKKIELAYWIDRSFFSTETSVEDTVLPAWKITYNQGEVKHIPAFQ